MPARSRHWAAIVGVGLLGPLLALGVTWWPAVQAARVDTGSRPAPEAVQALRSVPDDATLTELRSMAVGMGFSAGLPQDAVVETADALLQGQLLWDGRSYEVEVPFAPQTVLFEGTPLALRLSSLIVPAIMARAYEMTGNPHYLTAAVNYVESWATFEASQWIPRGLVLNDHATAARAVVLTELWRIYRDSAIYDPQQGAALVRYAQQLSGQLRDPARYNYRNNHGLMQSLALLHLSIAFPLHDDAAANARFAIERLVAQSDHLISANGVVLEHSPGYHRLVLAGLAAAARYAGIRGEALPLDLVEKYRRGIMFERALQRPDGTLPPIGDTGNGPHGRHRAAMFDERMVAAGPLAVPEANARPPAAVTIAAAEGYAILWSGVDLWPEAIGMSQMVLHWALFPALSHKHADELALSLWADGIQWIRSVGFWPYDAKRVEVISWRSSNAPHWYGESYHAERSSVLMASVTEGELQFLDVARKNADGSRLRRQVVRPDPRAWVVVDGVEGGGLREAEIVWRFSPGLELQEVSAKVYRLVVGGQASSMSVRFAGVGDWTIDADPQGTAEWNTGVMSAGGAVPSPAIRVSGAAGSPAIVTVFELEPPESLGQLLPASLAEWTSFEQWRIVTASAASDIVGVGRDGSTLFVDRHEGQRATAAIQARDSLMDRMAMERAFAAYAAARSADQQPFDPMLERRTKVSGAIGASALVQLLFFVAVRKRRSLWLPLLALSAVAWISLAGFLSWQYLV